jgi:hypothetical protein
LDDTKLHAIIATEKSICMAGEACRSKNGGSLVMKTDAGIKQANIKVFSADDYRAYSDHANDLLAHNNMLFTCGTCKFNDRQSFSISSFKENLDSVKTTFLFTNNRGECQKTLVDKQRRVWVAGKAKLGKDELGLGVACLNNSLDTVFTTC